MYLLDTNVLIWLATEPNKVPQTVRAIFSGQGALSYISIVSAWEYGQKRKLKPETLPTPFNLLISKMPHEKLDLDFNVFPYAESLPLIHRDPFDRMLIAQAIHHSLTFVTKDREIHRYPVKTLW